jgi:secernin
VGPISSFGSRAGVVCDCLVALAPATRDGVTLFAKNSDRPPQEAQLVERHEARSEQATNTTYLTVEPHSAPTIAFVGSRPEWMWGVEHGVNAAGVAIGNATIYTTLDPRGAPPGLTGMDLVRLGLERAATAADAVAVMTRLLERHGQGGSGHTGTDRPYWSSFLVADPTSAFVVETSGSTWEAMAVERVAATSNRTTLPSFDAEHRHPRQPVERLVDPRLRASGAVLAAEPVTVESLTGHLRSHAGGDDGWTICMHVADVEATTASIVAELPADGPPVVHLCTGSPCTAVYDRCVVTA